MPNIQPNTAEYVPILRVFFQNILQKYFRIWDPMKNSKFLIAHINQINQVYGYKIRFEMSQIEQKKFHEWSQNWPKKRQFRRFTVYRLSAELAEYSAE